MSDEQRAREIDVLVAEHIFGAEWHDCEDGWRVLRRYDADRSCYSIVATMTPNGYVGDVSGWYSTTWEGMGLVVEKMREEGWWFRLTCDNTDLWDVDFWHGEPDSWFSTDNRATAANPPESVALAALRAKGVDVAALVGGET